MTLLDYLDTLRAKPVHVRKRIAFVTTFALSALIATVWITANDHTTSVTKNVATTPSPWTVALNSLSDTKNASVATLKSATGNLQNILKDNLAAVDTANIPTTTSEGETPIQ